MALSKYSTMFLLVGFSLSMYAQPATYKPNLMPIPTSISMGSSQLRLDPTFRVSVKGIAGDRLLPATNRFLKRLAARTGVFLKQPVASASDTVANPTLLIRCERTGKIVLGEDESYTLEVKAGQIVLKAPTDLGAMHGLETLLQLLDADAQSYFFPTATITDVPRFPWRGLMIDAARRFQPLEGIRRNLDGMAMMKLNVFHWHLSDDQGFRVESNVYPKLHQLGSDGLYYTQDQIKETIRYADERGIRVVPEFDMPAHVTSWLVGYPELASQDTTYTLQRRWGVFKPTLDPTKETTYRFLDGLIKEMAALFPDAYFHIGGDENEGSQWKKSPTIQAFMKANNIANNHALQAYFNKRVLPIVTREGKNMIGWDEILSPEMPKNIVIHSWRGKKYLVDAAKQGYKVILSNGYYIDLNYSTATHYLNDPIPANSPLDAESRKNVLGGEATMWSEYGDPSVIDSRIWPRTAAIAERLWSPAEVRDVADMYRRLAVISTQLEELGLQHEQFREMLFRRMARGSDVSPIRTLVEVVEPVKEYKRGAQGVRYTSFSPLTRVADAASPESLVGRRFANLVDAFLQYQINNSVDKSKNKDVTPPDVKAIERQLQAWQENNMRLKPIIATSPILKEVEGVSEDLSAIAGAGLEALTHIQSGKKVSKDWLDSKKPALDAAKKPRGQVELVVVDSIAKLINWASVK